MRRLINVIVVLATAAMTLYSCEKYEDGRPSRGVRNEFSEMYPDAREVEWEAEAGYWKVSFELGKAPDVKECEAWYDAQGNWVRTEIDVFASALPQSVKDALAASEYASAVISDNDIEFVQTPEGDYYQLELNFNGVKVRLNVSEEGDVSLAF